MSTVLPQMPGGSETGQTKCPPQGAGPGALQLPGQKHYESQKEHEQQEALVEVPCAQPGQHACATVRGWDRSVLPETECGRAAGSYRQHKAAADKAAGK